MGMDAHEFARWLEASDDEAAVARELVNAEAYNAVVLHSEQAAQLALKGLLRGAGAARDAWGHGLSELANRAATAAALPLTPALQARLSILERDYMPSRYPDALVSGTPRGNYGAQDAVRALETFQSLRALVGRTWDQLDEAGRIDDAHPPGSAP